MQAALEGTHGSHVHVMGIPQTTHLESHHYVHYRAVFPPTYVGCGRDPAFLPSPLRTYGACRYLNTQHIANGCPTVIPNQLSLSLIPTVEAEEKQTLVFKFKASLAARVVM